MIPPGWRGAGATGTRAVVALQVLETWTLLNSLLEKEMAPHSSILAWRIPWTEEPGGLQSVGLEIERYGA